MELEKKEESEIKYGDTTTRLIIILKDKIQAKANISYSEVLNVEALIEWLRDMGG